MALDMLGGKAGADFGGGDLSTMLANEMEMLSDLFEESDDIRGNAENDRVTREEEAAAGVQGRLGPGDIGPKVAKTKKQDEKKKEKLTGDIWEGEDVPEEDLNWVEEGDDRPEPEYTTAYKQRVGSEDVFLGIGGRDPGSHCCESLVYKIKLPGVDSIEMISLDVTKNTLRISTPKNRLAMYLPHEVKDKDGNAKWDSDKGELELTLPIIHGGLFDEYATGEK